MAKSDLQVTVTIESLRDSHAKCARCSKRHLGWGAFGHTKQDIEETPKFAREKLCQRCIDIILIQNPDHPSVPYIKLYTQKEKDYNQRTGGWIDSFDKVVLHELDN